MANAVTASSKQLALLQELLAAEPVANTGIPVVVAPLGGSGRTPSFSPTMAVGQDDAVPGGCEDGSKTAAEEKRFLEKQNAWIQAELARQDHSEEKALQILHLEALAAEQIANGLAERCHNATAQALAWEFSKERVVCLRAEEKELRDRLCAAQQDYSDTCNGHETAQERQKEAAELVQHELESQASEAAVFHQECSAMESQACADVTALRDTTAAADSGMVEPGVALVGSSPCLASGAVVAAHEERTQALLELSAARLATSASSEACEEARSESLLAEQALRAQQEAAAQELQTLRSVLLRDSESELRAAESSLAGAAAQNEDVLRRAAVWCKLSESSKTRAQSGQQGLQRAEQRVMDLEAKATSLREQFDALTQTFSSASRVSGAAEQETQQSEQHRSVALMALVFALGFAVARLGAFLI